MSTGLEAKNKQEARWASESEIPGTGEFLGSGVSESSEVTGEESLSRQEYQCDEISHRAGEETCWERGGPEALPSIVTHRRIPRVGSSDPRPLARRGPGPHSEAVQHPEDSAGSGSHVLAGLRGICDGRSLVPRWAVAQSGWACGITYLTPSGPSQVLTGKNQRTDAQQSPGKRVWIWLDCGRVCGGLF